MIEMKSAGITEISSNADIKSLGTYDPDKRIDPNFTEKDVGKSSEQASFDPDKRIDVSCGDIKKQSEYDVNKRLNAQESFDYVADQKNTIDINSKNEATDCSEKGKPIQNKIDGLQREADVKKDLETLYPSDEDYDIISEAYLRDADGNIVKDTETEKARRIDFVVVKDGNVVDSIEVTSETADKTDQIAKETRIRENGGNYIRDNDGNLIRIPDDVNTRIERRK